VIDYAARLTDLLLNIAADLIVMAGQRVHLGIREENRIFVGKWYGLIFADDDGEQQHTLIKWDEVECHQRGNHVWATCTRKYAATDSERELQRSWKFEGRLRGEALFGHFWNTVEGDPSCGAIVLHLERVGRWLGCYTRFQITAHAMTVNSERRTVPYRWQREEPVVIPVASPAEEQPPILEASTRPLSGSVAA